MKTGLILTLAYPETIVSHAEEWYSKYLHWFGIGSKHHVRAGHAALVLIERSTGVLEYHDFGRYITPEPNGRVRGKGTDHELHFPMKAELVSDSIQNLDSILKFLATNPKITHGDGNLYASVCSDINYKRARDHINKMQQKEFIRYAAFKTDACNCARFVTDSLIEGTTNKSIKRKLKRSKLFTPSTIGNVVLADTENYVYKVNDQGEIGEYNSSVTRENWKLFTDRLRDYNPSIIGTIKPKPNDAKNDHAQWLGGIAAGAWFELYDTDRNNWYRYRRISPQGHIDVDSIYEIEEDGFDITKPYDFVHYSNCQFFHIEQEQKRYRFELIGSGRN